ncbi:putative dehydrogenase [Pseudoclavibacter chungangensis]|uniref:Gfo/Idh/MocA family protein n=1 Tax=Pseudoclavibacter chungangensis TaxID=587635 RepID=UPI0015CA96F2|nr:Gfo/Idh/MocA family oxidoreductase [Pseudoclavibacter chungangensis]NYJ68770.1 putative dehydrogenase [Pseudoclavibacter chungangensis]
MPRAIDGAAVLGRADPCRRARDEVGVGILGAGPIGRTHAETVTATAGFARTAVTDPFDGGRVLAEAFGVRHHLDHHELPTANTVDAVIIAAPKQFHVPMALEFVAASIPVLVEKLVATSLEEALALVEASERSGVPGLGHHRRHYPVPRRAKQLTEAGRLRPFVVVDVTYFLSKPVECFDIARRRTAASGGAFLSNLIREIDLLRYLVREITDVTALASAATSGGSASRTRAH